MIDIIGYDLDIAKKMLLNNKVKFEIIETKPTKIYNGYQYRVIRTKIYNDILKVTISKF
ncbi:hypothetical protein [Thermoanaerobacterium sp. RBIITD]|uniref:hypothetical protein n=1 Tax=Thermoanaerobacterium sp. RBIITD TaxID=1550240 RepID=UPI000BC0967C|nr:hypothetical protein [Thermoanaerobacterium sp. RBIITD]SNX55486.1 hypothetical protein SAMN05660242_3312 [Thermoanaerobacterium sp. RBIITD]